MKAIKTHVHGTCEGERRPISKALFLGAVMMSAIPGANAAGIVTDGGTATSVTTTASGHQTVAIAPAYGGVSNNTYRSFNVSKAGADLNNAGINARTIVNQVTSTNPSLIQGAVNVQGPRANVILANPNGITVDGGSFTNAGHVVLSTGQVSFADINLVPGQIQRNVVLTTDRGTIAIGPGGLSGTLINLDLVSKQLVVNGPVSNEYSSSTGGVRAIAGSSTTTWDTALSPGDNGHDWLAVLASPEVQGPAIEIDITEAGGLTAGRVSLIVTGQGAGMRSAGTLDATAGDVIVQANGDITVAGGSMTAANDLSMKSGGSISVEAAAVSAKHDVNIAAGMIAVSDRTGAGSTIAGAHAVTLTAAGDITNTGSLIQAGLVQPDGSLSGGDLVINAGGNITNRSDVANLAILFSANGQMGLSAQGDITNDNARMLANGAMLLNAQGDVNNVIEHTGGVNGGSPVAYSREGGGILFFVHRSSGFSVDYGTVTQPDQLSLIASTAGPVSISARNFTNSGGLVQSNDGDITVHAQDAFKNAAVFAGQASYSQSCFIFCHGSASSNVTPYGGAIQAGGNVVIEAGTSAANIGGNVYAHGDIKVDAPLTYAASVTGYSAINQSRGFKAFFGSTWAQIIATDIGGGFTADGLVTLTGDGLIDGGYISAGRGAIGRITTLHAPTSTPAQIGQHLGLSTWWWF